MNILNLLIIVPVFTILGINLMKDYKGARLTAAFGMGLQLLLSIVLVILYLNEREAGNSAQMLFVSDYVWYESFNIHYAIGVDGISVSLILLTGIIAFVGVFASWEIENQAREFYTTLIVLATGVFGFFISLDLFTMFLFYEIAVIPMYLLIGIWGSGRKEYSAMKLTLMLMGASALLLVGIIGIYFNSAPEGQQLTFNFIEIAKYDIPLCTIIFLSTYLYWFWGIRGVISFAYMVARWSCLCANSCIYAACRCIDEVRRIWSLTSCCVFNASCRTGNGLVLYHPCNDRCCLWCPICIGSKRS